MRTNNNIWDDEIVSYLKLFKDFHPIHPTNKVITHLTEGFYLHTQHYCNNGYYCVLTVGKHGKPIVAKIYSNI